VKDNRMEESMEIISGLLFVSVPLNILFPYFVEKFGVTFPAPVYFLSGCLFGALGVVVGRLFER